MKIKKVLVDRKGNWNYWEKGDFHSLFGTIKEKDIKSGKIKSHIDKEFICFDASFRENVYNMKKGPAVVLPKDVGFIIAYCGIGKNSKVVEAGAGAGVLTSFLGNISDNVYSYEVNEEFYNLSKKNLEELNINVNLKNKDITKGIDEDDLDAVILDLPNPWDVLEEANKKLKSGGFLVCYLPSIMQVSEVVEKANSFVFDRCVELLEREWHIEGKRVRPKSSMIGHTAFLVFFRKV
ncbi:MAG: methyltransferase [Candidatus Woesearchaeota archaeon]|nr:MAG: methyltransferase [Candidatus Woesearchaeota archaeon]